MKVLPATTKRVNTRRSTGAQHTLATASWQEPRGEKAPQPRRPPDRAAPRDFPVPSRLPHTQILSNLKIVHRVDLEILLFLLQISGEGKNTEADRHLGFGPKSPLGLSAFQPQWPPNPRRALDAYGCLGPASQRLRLCWPRGQPGHP